MVGSQMSQVQMAIAAKMLRMNADALARHQVEIVREYLRRNLAPTNEANPGLAQPLH